MATGCSIAPRTLLRLAAGLGVYIHLHDILDLSITNHGTIDHVVDDFGPPTNALTQPNDVVAYP